MKWLDSTRSQACLVIVMGGVTLGLPHAARSVRADPDCFACVPALPDQNPMDELEATRLCGEYCDNENWTDHVEMTCEVPEDGFGDEDETPWRAQCAAPKR